MLAIAAGAAVVLAGEVILSQPPAAPLPSQPVPVVRYGDLGGPGSPYGPALAPGGGGASPYGGAFSDQQPSAVTTAGQPQSWAALNGGNRGFPAQSLTVNQRLP